MARLEAAGRGLIYALPLVFFGLFYVYPLAAIFELSFTRQAESGWLLDLLSDPYTWRLLWFTVWQAALSTLLTLILALPGAYVFARYRFWGKETLRAIITLPFVLPTIVVATAFTALIGPRGLLNQTLMTWFDLAGPPINLNHTLWAILLAHVFYNYSLALRMVSGFWQNLSPQVEEAALMLGASPRQVFWQVTWPRLWPAVTAAALLVFVFCFTSFGVILILGGPQFATLEVEIYLQAANLFNLPVAAALSLLQILFTLLLMVLYTRTQRRAARPLRLQSVTQAQRAVRSWSDWLVVGGNVGLMGLLLGAPLFALVWRSFRTDSGFSLRYYQALFVNQRGSALFVTPIESVVNSLQIAGATVGLAVVVGLCSALLLSRPQQGWVRWLDPLFMLPLTTSAVTLGFGYVLTRSSLPFGLGQSWWLIPVVHALVGIPFVIRSILPALQRLPPSLKEAALILGATPAQAWWRVEWPLVRRAVLVGAVFAFTISMGEFGASIFLARPQAPTLPVAIYRYLGQPGAMNYGQALAMSSVLMLVCAVGFVAIERFRLGDEGEF